MSVYATTHVHWNNHNLMVTVPEDTRWEGIAPMIIAAIDERTPNQVVVDLGAIERIDTHILGLLMRLRQYAFQAFHATIKIINSPSSMAAVLAILGIQNFFQY